jgi:MFS family permease
MTTQDLSELREERKAFPTFRERTFKALAWSCVVSFASLMIVGIFISFSPIPGWDWWDCALEFVAEVKAGKFSAWFAPCYEHRMVLPKVLFWLDVNLFGGHSLFALLGGLTFGVFAWLLLFCIALPERTTPGDHRFYIGATLALLAFSWMQISNFLGGIGTAPEFMVIFFPLATFFALVKSQKSPLSFFAAILLGIGSAGTGANGLLALPIATALALALEMGWWRVALLAVISAAVWAAYFTDFNFLYESTKFAAFANPIGFLQFFFAYVGNVAFYVAFTGIAGVDVLLHGWSAAHTPGKQLNDFPQAVAWSLVIAQVCGAIFTAMSLREIVHWYRSDRNPLDGALIAVILFAFATASVTAAGRLDHFGVIMAVATRFTTTMLFALGAYILLRSRHLNYYQAGILFFCIAIVLFPRQLTALRESPSAAEHAEQQRAYQSLKMGKATETDLSVLGLPDVVRRASGRLKEMGMELPR